MKFFACPPWELTSWEAGSLGWGWGSVRNRFKGIDLIDRVPDELWTEVCDIVQETGIKTIPQKINAKKQNGCMRRPYK